MDPTLDTIDRKILIALQTSGRASNVELAGTVHLSAPQCYRRTRALEERGVIRGYAAQVDAGALGFGVTAYVNLSLAGDQFARVREIESVIAAYPEVLECHAVSGDYDYLLKVVAHDLKSLSQLLTDRLMQIAGVDDVRSMICLEEIKPPSPVPVG
ncbi:MAG: Lrp/AsnC family transcriptional regulator [Caldimonas sp.]